MENNNDEEDFLKALGNGLKFIGSGILKLIGTKVILITLVIILAIVLIGSLATYFIKRNEGIFDSNDESNVPNNVSNFQNGYTISSSGDVIRSMTPQQLWDAMVENETGIQNYLEGPEELAKLVNAESVTKYLDMRPDTDQPIDWDLVNDIDSTTVQGVIKLKRADSAGNVTSLTYVDPGTFQNYIDDYEETGSDEAKQSLTQHYTIGHNATAKSIKRKVGDIDVERMSDNVEISFTRENHDIHMEDGAVIATGDYTEGSIIYIETQSEGQASAADGKFYYVAKVYESSTEDKIEIYRSYGTETSDPYGTYDSGRVSLARKKDTWQNYQDNYQYYEYLSSNEDMLIWPTVSVNISSGFGYRDVNDEEASTDHKGIDIAIPENSDIYATKDGVILEVGNHEKAGIYVTVDHGEGMISRYLHNNEILVSVGQQVKAGDIIALSGNTGTSTGPHLHFEIQQDGVALDPSTFEYDIGTVSGNNSKNAVIATFSETVIETTTNDKNAEIPAPEVRKTVNTVEINYSNMVSNYSLPFDFLWSLIVIGGDKYMALELANLVYESDIEITIFENTTYTTNVVTEAYDIARKIVNYGKVTVNELDSVGTLVSTQSYNYPTQDPNTLDFEIVTGNTTDGAKCYVTRTTNTVSTSLNIEVTKANTWIVEYTKEFTYNPGVAEVTGGTPSDLPEIEEEMYHVDNSDRKGIISGFLTDKKTEKSNSRTDMSTTIMGTINSKSEDVYDKKTNRVETVTLTVTKSEYIASPPVTIEKTDPNDEKMNFVKIYQADENQKFRNNLSGAEQWLFEILQENASTANMVDLVKYLLYKSTGVNYGVTSINFESLFRPGTNLATSNSGKISYESLSVTQEERELLYKITHFERGGGTQEQQEYVVSVILSRVLSSEFPNTIEGVVMAKNQFAPTSKDSWNTYKETDASSTTKAAVDNVIDNGGTAGYAVFFMTPKAAMDPDQAWLGKPPYIYLFNDAGEEYRYSGEHGTHNFYTKESIEIELAQYKIEGSEDEIMQIAQNIQDFLCANQYTYCSLGTENDPTHRGLYSPHGLNSTFEESKTGHHLICCATLVSWILYDYGYTEFAGYHGVIAQEPLIQNIATRIPVSSYDDMLPGDIVVWADSGHVQMYAGDMTWYNAGNTDDIRSPGPNFSNVNLGDKRIYRLNEFM